MPSELTDELRVAVLDEIWARMPGQHERYRPGLDVLLEYDGDVRARAKGREPFGILARIDKATSDALSLFGVDHQLGKLKEECLELALALEYLRQGRVPLEKVAEEVVGVRFVSMQAEKFLGHELMQAATAEQLAKLEVHIAKKRAQIAEGHLGREEGDGS